MQIGRRMMTKRGTTMLHYAARCRSVKAIRTLLAARAKVRTEDAVRERLQSHASRGLVFRFVVGKAVDRSMSS
jgi:hypothetical protein